MSLGSRLGAGPVLAVVFLALAGWFLFGPDPLVLPAEIPAVRIHPSQISTAARRSTLSHPPRIEINGFERTCMECHRTFPQKTDSGPLLQHTHIALDHGNHRKCAGCHDAEDRDLLVKGDEGTKIRYDDATSLCAHCHERVFDEWIRGSHGRSNGSWDESSGERQRLHCVQCHDPHQPQRPAMDPLAPLPPPRTLRMGEPHHDLEVDHSENPLRRTREHR